ncbi:hypothetical protein TthSNM11_01810 [Thermus thermophilus]|nr:hypothetical protein TthHB5002_01690 [Thermus thermophilus]BDG17978.1 hypothetical protein TthSNM11_01810 [Thermus thermophilus]BDG20517.1 hypothetical protein TthSNM17_01790 [Thermus thermophilus]BDG22982.1 hypothetical protein TthSNM33_01760 [Thermus thermophilus]BDG27968.1 hypothetical protein TthSNM76_01780 [Thermus thermophilus]
MGFLGGEPLVVHEEEGALGPLKVLLEGGQKLNVALVRHAFLPFGAGEPRPVCPGISEETLPLKRLGGLFKARRPPAVFGLGAGAPGVPPWSLSEGPCVVKA